MIVGIDASRNRSGGAVAHLTGILGEGNPFAHSIREVHVWSYKKLLDALPDEPWLVRHNPSELERSLFWQIWWQYHKLPGEAKKYGCDVLFATDAATISRFSPMVVMSQDMLSYEPGVMRYFGLSKAWLRLLAILIIQNRAMRFADGVIFLTRYAAQIIQQKTGKLNRIKIIPHGIGPAFKQQNILKTCPRTGEQAIRCLYVSNTAMYKHQWMVVRAIAQLRRRGIDIKITLAGGGSGRAQQLLDKEIATSDPHRAFVEVIGFVPHDNLPSLLADSDIFVFASSCENLPVTLLEAMAVGLPIACSDRGPMPEILKDGGVYFDPENPESIVLAIEKIISNENVRINIAKLAKELSAQYSWQRCAVETWEFLKTTVESKKYE